jgi:hypothetical protein
LRPFYFKNATLSGRGFRPRLGRGNFSTGKGVFMPTKQNPLTPEGSSQLNESFFTQLRDRFTGKRTDQIDIIDAIKEDHKALKDLIPLLKGEGTYEEKRGVFAFFAAALEAHAKPEEQTWYAEMKASADMKVDGYEGDVEHALADQLANELKTTADENVFMAKAKVLAEMLEHHITEEEQTMIPDYQKNSTSDERARLGAKYLKLRSAYLTH